ncbi:MAG: hypothetical protein QGF00_14610 [Planctomycetota bacterium]|nr:hypothetical protein [Planctomycetota bacterium]
MLREVLMVKQVPGQPFRRWFTDQQHDLYVWYDDRRREIIGFQFCYGRNKDEKALTYLDDRGWKHSCVDDGETRKSEKGTTILGPAHMTPIMTKEAGYDAPELANRFGEASGDLDPEIAEYVQDKIRTSVEES